VSTARRLVFAGVVALADGDLDPRHRFTSTFDLPGHLASSASVAMRCGGVFVNGTMTSTTAAIFAGE
jgi:hypothetical protein